MCQIQHLLLSDLNETLRTSTHQQCSKINVHTQAARPQFWPTSQKADQRAPGDDHIQSCQLVAC
jgi:hypothetical protein